MDTHQLLASRGRLFFMGPWPCWEATAGCGKNYISLLKRRSQVSGALDSWWRRTHQQGYTNEECLVARPKVGSCKHGNAWSIGNAARFYIAPILYHTDFPGELFLLRQISYETNNVPSQVLANISLQVISERRCKCTPSAPREFLITSRLSS